MRPGTRWAAGASAGRDSGSALGAYKIPEPATPTSSSSVIGEEMGLLGSTMVVVAFLLLVGAGLRIAQAARSEFAKLTAVGLTMIIGFQAFFIIGGVVRLLPLTGITLPFVSYGGSALVANYVLIALLMRISDEGGAAVDSADQAQFEQSRGTAGATAERRLSCRRAIRSPGRRRSGADVPPPRTAGGR